MTKESATLDEREEARRGGSDHVWYVLQEHCIDNGVLKEGRVWPGGGRAVVGHRREYFPFAHPELVSEFSKLREGDEEAVLTFANEWGLLGYDGLIHSHPGWLDQAEPRWEWIEREADRQGGFLVIHVRPTRIEPGGKIVPSPWIVRQADRQGGDPLSWIWAHAETVRRLLRLIELLKDETEQPIDRYLAQIAVERRVPPRPPTLIDDLLFSRFQVAVGIDAQDEVTTEIVRPELRKSHHFNLSAVDEARTLVSTVIDRNMADVRPLVTHVYPPPQGGTGLQRNLSFRALLSIIYWYLSEAALGQRSYRRCAWCGERFEQRHGLQNYCPPDLEGTESQCALKARQRKFRDKKYRARRTLAKGEGHEQARE